MRLIKIAGASLAAVVVVGGAIGSASPVLAASASSTNLSQCHTNTTGKSCETLTGKGLYVKSATGTATTNATGSGHFVLRVTESGHGHNFVSPTFSYVPGQTVTWSVTCSSHCAVIDESTFRMVFIPTPSTSAANAANKITVT
jgi:hypothetical protein